MSESRKIIEAALFMSPKPLAFDEFYNLTKENISMLRSELNQLVEDYSGRDSALEIVESALGFQMKVKQEYEEIVARLASGTHLSKSATKTLAYIAYKQPLKQSMLVRYRSSQAYDDVKQLLQEELISREADGRTFLLRTTKKFLKYFGADAVRLKQREKQQAAEIQSGERLQQE